ncbi:MAG: GNAT family N-acetyltransferase [Candidatus Izimaplasma sp.]|nr:GNAT family N-acetyltransferase [Candidatus Izimaplasma bacterium]
MIKILLPVMETTRLTLRPLSLIDIDDVFEYAQSPLVGPNAGWRPHTSKLESEAFIKYSIKKREFGQPGIYAIVLRKNNKMIGTIEIHSYNQYKAEIGFVLNPDYWAQGIVVEAAKAVIVYGFEILRLKRLQYGYFLFNVRSKRVCEKLEFTKEGILRNKFQNYNGEIIDEVVASITHEDYHSNKIAWIVEFKKGLKVDSKGF